MRALKIEIWIRRLRGKPLLAIGPIILYGNGLLGALMLFILGIAYFYSDLDSDLFWVWIVMGGVFLGEIGVGFNRDRVKPPTPLGWLLIALILFGNSFLMIQALDEIGSHRPLPPVLKQIVEIVKPTEETPSETITEFR